MSTLYYSECFSSDPVLTIIIPYKFSPEWKVSSLIRSHLLQKVYLWLVPDWQLAIYPTPSEAVAIKYFSRQMQCSAQEELCNMGFRIQLPKLEKGTCEWAEDSFLWGKASITLPWKEGGLSERKQAGSRAGPHTSNGSEAFLCLSTPSRYPMKNATDNDFVDSSLLMNSTKQESVDLNVEWRIMKRKFWEHINKTECYQNQEGLFWSPSEAWNILRYQWGI